MTTQSSIPQKWYVPFANGDTARVEIPVTTADPTRASQTLGFPPLTMQPPESGGVPPQGEDFNGGMNQIARVAWWTLLCGGWPYDPSFATNSNIGGYPNGATLQSADLRGQWISLVDNNQINPDTVGTNWVPGFQYGGTSLSALTGGTVTPTPAQAAKNGITLSGTLASALTVILPTWIKNWTITNNTSGAFVVTVKTLAGSGVTIPQNGSPTLVRGDGTNITQVGENIAAATSPTQAPQLQQMTGRLIGVQRFTSAAGTFTYTPTAGMTTAIVEVQGAGGGGGGTAATVASQFAIGSGAGSGSYAKVLLTAAQIGASQTITNGAGGTVSAGGNGGTGGTTTFGSLISCPGGSGGASGGNVAVGTIYFNVSAAGGGTPTVSTGTTIISTQGNRSVGSGSGGTNALMNGNGAGSPMVGGGGGGAGAGFSAPGSGATSVGGGGAAGAGASVAAQAGGAGGFGGVIVWEYF